MKFLKLLRQNLQAEGMNFEHFSLLVWIAGAQDSSPGFRPVFISNERLIDGLGMKRKKLDRVRREAVEKGWLEYERGSNGSRGRYSISVPNGLTYDPALVDHQADALPPTPPKGRGSHGQVTALIRTSNGHISNKPSPSPSLGDEKKGGTSIEAIPDIQQVKDYFEKHGIAHPERFYYHHEARGWKGIRDWRAAAEGWKLHPLNQSASPANEPEPRRV